MGTRNPSFPPITLVQKHTHTVTTTPTESSRSITLPTSFYHCDPSQRACRLHQIQRYRHFLSFILLPQYFLPLRLLFNQTHLLTYPFLWNKGADYSRLKQFAQICAVFQHKPDWISLYEHRKMPNVRSKYMHNYKQAKSSETIPGNFYYFVLLCLLHFVLRNVK